MLKKIADFLLVNKGVLTCPVTEIHEAKPEATYFAGSDYQADGKRAYSSYFELAAPFRLATCDWDARLGQLVANPASRHFYFIFGLTLKAI